MSKQVLTLGYFDHNFLSHGLISGTVDRNPTRVDVSDTSNNNDLLVGRKVWLFNIQTISDNIKPIATDDVPAIIAISLGDSLYTGYGKIISVSHSGSIDNKIIYNVSGELFPYGGAECFFGTDINNAQHWVNEDGNNTPDGWSVVSGSPSISVDEYGKYTNFGSLFSGFSFYQGKTYDTGEDYFWYFKYAASGWSSLYLDMGSTNQLFAGTTYPVGGAWTNFAAAAGDNQIEVRGAPGTALKVYRAVVAKVVDSLT